MNENGEKNNTRGLVSEWVKVRKSNECGLGEDRKNNTCEEVYETGLKTGEGKHCVGSRKGKCEGRLGGHCVVIGKRGYRRQGQLILRARYRCKTKTKVDEWEGSGYLDLSSHRSVWVINKVWE